jgi:V/A-type H+/Na+-transporting ATPase subunit C
MIRDDYTYASAKIRCLEKHLLSDSDMTRVIDAKNPDIAFKAFNSLDYAGELLDLEAKDYRTAMGRKMDRLKKVLRHVVPDQDLLRLLFMERDYYNIKYLFKLKACGKEPGDLSDLSPGINKVDQLKRYIIDELEADIDLEISGDINDLRKQIGDSTDAEMIANLVNRRLNRRNRDLTVKLNNPFIITLYKYLADKNNVSLFLRARRLERNKSWFAERVNEAGHIPATALLDLYEGNEEAFLSELQVYMPNLIKEYTDEFSKDHKIWHVELGLNNVIIDHLRSAKLIGAGPEVVVAYFFAKKYAIKNLSTIMALKFGEIEPTEIRKHLVSTY